MRSASIEQFRQRVIAMDHLGPLDESETRGFIEHRLQHVGWKGATEFNDAAIHQIFVAAGGIPRRINAICNRLMLAGFLAGQRKFSDAEVKHVVSEFAGEIGPRTVATPLLDAARVKRVSETEIASSIRCLAKLPDRMESLEQDMMELRGTGALARGSRERPAR